MTASSRGAALARLEAMARARSEASEAFFPAQADTIARLCHRMAERFSAGGRLLAVAEGPAARSDARHVAVEFVHPVIVGKRALPAVALSAEGGPLSAQIEVMAEPGDIVIAFGGGDDSPEPAAALAIAARRGCLTIAFSPLHADWTFDPPGDPFVRQELVETLYHVLWELVHVFFDHPGLLEGRVDGRRHDAGASSFLYPFLGEDEDDLEPVVEAVRASVLMKAQDTAALREHTLTRDSAALLGAAAELRTRLLAGGRLLTFGNGGSATDAMDATADFRAPAAGGPARPCLDLTEDTAVLTAVANDIGTEAMFTRQVIAHGRPGDALLAFSTSGSSANVVSALAQARRQKLLTIAMLGYDGGRIAAEGLADHLVLAPSEHIPRIQEAHASASHALRVLVELGPGDD